MERKNYYYDSPFFYGLILWRRRLAVTCVTLIAIMIVHGRSAPEVEDMWFWTGIIFGVVGGICFLRMCCYQSYLIVAMGTLDNSTIVGSMFFDRIERKHAVWYEKKFGRKPPKTNTWRNA